VSPNDWFVGNTYRNVTFTGTNFTTSSKATKTCPATTLSIDIADGEVTVSGINVASATKITGTVRVASGASTESATADAYGDTAPTPDADVLGEPSITWASDPVGSNPVIAGPNTTLSDPSAVVGQQIYLTTTPTAQTLAALPIPLAFSNNPPQNPWQITGTAVADETAAKAAVAKAVDVFGRLDVLVNNAGYGDTAPFEQVSSERFSALIETNFFGVVSMTRAAIPIMRKQKSGWILQILSVGGRLATPGGAAYHAAKWAVGGFTESIAMEVAPFGVKVCALEPGGMRTNWGNRAHADIPILLPEYEPSVGAQVKGLEAYWGHETGDPAKVAQVIVQLAGKERLPAHLLLGSDAVQYARLAEEKRASEAKEWLEFSVLTDADGVQEQPDLKF